MPLTDPQAFVGSAESTRRRTSFMMGATNLGVVVLMAALVWMVLERFRRTGQEQARRVADGLAAVAQLNIQSEIDRVDAVIRATASEIKRY